jgi:hypothetical protein
MSIHNPKGDGALTCYICGYEDFEIHLNYEVGKVIILNLNPFPDIKTPSISTISCAKCGTLHYSTNKLKSDGTRGPAWFINNISGRWNEETRQIEYPKYKREVITSKEISVDNMIDMLKRAGFTADILKETK